MTITAFLPAPPSSHPLFGFSLRPQVHVLNNITSISTTPITTARHPLPLQLQVIKGDSSSSTTTGIGSISDDGDERSDKEVEKLVEGMDFGELCNEFECISSPYVESTARQLARDILELRQGNRALGTFSATVKYKDPLRTFTGREKYKRPLWVTNALDKPSVTVQEMSMLSTSLLSIRWTIKGIPKNIIASIGGDVIVRVTSQFTLNQISGQVIEHEEFWDLSASSVIAKAYFWTSRRLFSTIEAGKDTAEFLKNMANRFSLEKENREIYPDPSGDPTKSINSGAAVISLPVVSSVGPPSFNVADLQPFYEDDVEQEPDSMTSPFQPGENDGGPTDDTTGKDITAAPEL